MRYLIWWIKSWFCDHDWEYEEARISGRHSSLIYGEWVVRDVQASATCKKCGWHRSYRKFNI